MKRSAFCIFVLCIVAMFNLSSAQEPGLSPVQVFLLAGQSNMEGQGVVDLDHPDHYNGGRGTLQRVIEETDTPDLYEGVRDSNGEWTVRDDVFVRFQTRHELKRGGLSIGFAGYEGKHHVGPELQFGRVVGDAIDEPVLLIKTAWGGKSLYQDFRPPSAGGEIGPYYKQMFEEIDESLEAMGEDFPSLQGRGYEIAGFVWFQGWNDMCDADATAEYEQNLVHLINDVRHEFDLPELPIVVGELGNGGPDAGGNMLTFRRAQAAGCVRPEFEGTVAFVETTDCARPAEDSPNKGHGHHWFGNAESYYLVGDALGRAMLELLEE
jgi:hypothetical protein